MNEIVKYREYPDTKLCTVCKLEKPIDKFGWKRQKTLYGISMLKQSACNPCRVDLDVEYKRRKGVPVKVKRTEESKKRRTKEAMRRFNLKFKFGLTIEDYSLLLEAQDGVCAICGKDQLAKEGKNLSVDHCHSTLKIRGLLCTSCNTMLGLTMEKTEVLYKAIEYIEFYKNNESKFIAKPQGERKSFKKRVVEYNGETLTLSDCVRKYSKVPYDTVLSRINTKNGRKPWELERAMMEPTKEQRDRPIVDD